MPGSCSHVAYIMSSLHCMKAMCSRKPVLLSSDVGHDWSNQLVLRYTVLSENETETTDSNAEQTCCDHACRSLCARPKLLTLEPHKADDGGYHARCKLTNHSYGLTSLSYASGTKM